MITFTYRASLATRSARRPGRARGWSGGSSPPLETLGAPLIRFGGGALRMPARWSRDSSGVGRSVARHRQRGRGLTWRFDPGRTRGDERSAAADVFGLHARGGHQARRRSRRRSSGSPTGSGRRRASPRAGIASIGSGRKRSTPVESVLPLVRIRRARTTSRKSRRIPQVSTAG